MWVDYDVSFNGHFQRALHMLSVNLTRNGKSYPNSLYYAALELRIAIERVLWESMALAKKSESSLDKLSKREIKLYKPKEIWQKMLDIDPLLEKRFTFLRIVHEVDPKFLKLANEVIPEPILEMPDVDKLDELYGRIGSYLHAIEKRQHSINDSTYWDRFKALLEETMAELDKAARGRIHFTPQGRAKEAFDMLVAGASEETVLQFMKSGTKSK